MCEHTNKAYSPLGLTLTVYPPIHISNWICKDCGFEGQDRKQDALSSEYDQTRAKFGKTPNNSFTTR